MAYTATVYREGRPCRYFFASIKEACAFLSHPCNLTTRRTLTKQGI